MSSGAPWWAFIVTAVVSLGSALFSWLMTHRSASKRDLDNWRRTTLVQSTMELLEASNERFEAVKKTETKNAASDLMRKITRHYQTIRLIADDDLNRAARAIWEAHTFSAKALSRIPETAQSEAIYKQKIHFLLIYTMTDEWELQGQHQTLTSELKKSISSRKSKKAHPDTTKQVDPDLSSRN